MINQIKSELKEDKVKGPILRIHRRLSTILKTRKKLSKVMFFKM